MRTTGWRRLTARLLPLILLAATASALTTSAAGQVVKVGNIVIDVTGGFFPHRLPSKVEAPIRLEASVKIKTADGTHLPAAKVFNLEFDDDGRLNTVGLPTCSVGQLENLVTSEAKRVCGSSLVGTGRAGAEIELPEQPPFYASGALLVFNGPPRGGRPMLIFHVYAFVPAPTTFVTTAVIEKAKGPYGTRAVIQVPTIVAGQGSLKSARINLGKTWTHKGRKQHLLLARCKTGSFVTRGDLTFADGSRLAGKVVRSCVPID